MEKNSSNQKIGELKTYHWARWLENQKSNELNEGNLSEASQKKGGFTLDEADSSFFFFSQLNKQMMDSADPLNPKKNLSPYIDTYIAGETSKNEPIERISDLLRLEQPKLAHVHEIFAGAQKFKKDELKIVEEKKLDISEEDLRALIKEISEICEADVVFPCLEEGEETYLIFLEEKIFCENFLLEVLEHLISLLP